MAGQYEIGELDLTAQANAAKSATNYITADSSGIKIHDAGDNLNYQHLTSDGTEIFKGGNSVAAFGETARIGKAYDSEASDNESHIELDYHSLKLIDKEGFSYFHVSDLREGNDGVAEITEKFRGDGIQTSFQLSFVATSTDYSVIVHTPSSAVADPMNYEEPETRNQTTTNFSFNTAPLEGATIRALYTSADNKLKAYTLGTRRSNQTIGAYSYAEGFSITASGNYSHGEGYDTKAKEKYSHTEGYNTEASGMASHAEGWSSKANEDWSHAEGYFTKSNGMNSHAEGRYTEAGPGGVSHAEGDRTKASGDCSHAEGQQTEASGSHSHAEGYITKASGYYSHAEGMSSEASGAASHAQNFYTTAVSKYQTALGKYNVKDSQIDTFTGDGAKKKFNLTKLSGTSLDFLITIDDVQIDRTDSTAGYYYYSNDNTINFYTAPKNNSVITIEYELSTYAAIIGNGTANDARSNALAVTWDGIVDLWANDQTIGVVPSSNQYRDRIVFNDSEGTRLGHIRTPFLTNGRQGIQLETIREVNGENKYNGVQLFLDSGGNPTVVVSSPEAWRTALEVIPSTGGTITDTLTLSKTTDLSGTANNSPALIVGGTAATAHMEIDSNEIQAKATGTTTAVLGINPDGGDVKVNGVSVRNASIINAGTLAKARGGTGISDIGDIINSGSITGTCNTGKWNTVASYSIPAGRWVISIQIAFPTNANGYRAWNFGTNNTAETYGAGTMGGGCVHAVTGVPTSVTSVAFVAISAATTYYVRVGQNSGTNFSSNITTCIRGMKIAAY